MLLVEQSSETGRFRHLSGQVFRVRNFGNAKAARVIFFFSKYSKFNVAFENAAKTREKFLISEIIASELVSLNCLH